MKAGVWDRWLPAVLCYTSLVQASAPPPQRESFHWLWFVSVDQRDELSGAGHHSRWPSLSLSFKPASLLTLLSQQDQHRSGVGVGHLHIWDYEKSLFLSPFVKRHNFLRDLSALRTAAVVGAKPETGSGVRFSSPTGNARKVSWCFINHGWWE